MMWEGDGTRGSTIITGGSSSYTITGLEEDSNYTITVTATNAAGSAVSQRRSYVQAIEASASYEIDKKLWACRYVVRVNVPITVRALSDALTTQLQL